MQPSLLEAVHPELAAPVATSLANATRFRVTVRDNGPGIIRNQIPHVFGRLLYGSKFHRLRMSRGQQGIGISAAGMYGLLTTGQSVEIISRTGKKKPAHRFELQMDTQKNRAEIIVDEELESWVRIGVGGQGVRGRRKPKTPCLPRPPTPDPRSPKKSTAPR